MKEKNIENRNDVTLEELKRIITSRGIRVYEGEEKEKIEKFKELSKTKKVEWFGCGFMFSKDSKENSKIFSKRIDNICNCFFKSKYTLIFEVLLNKDQVSGRTRFKIAFSAF